LKKEEEAETMSETNSQLAIRPREIYSRFKKRIRVVENSRLTEFVK
jgi:hypothetical protein